MPAGAVLRRPPPEGTEPGGPHGSPATDISGHAGKRFLTLSLYKDRGLDFDLDVDASGQIKLHQGVDCLIRRIENVDQPLVGARLELLPRLLVNVR